MPRRCLKHFSKKPCTKCSYKTIIDLEEKSDLLEDKIEDIRAEIRQVEELIIEHKLNKLMEKMYE